MEWCIPRFTHVPPCSAFFTLRLPRSSISPRQCLFSSWLILDTDAPPPTAAPRRPSSPKRGRRGRKPTHARSQRSNAPTNVHTRHRKPGLDRNAHPSAPATRMHTPRRPPSSPSTARALSPSATSPAGTPTYEGADSSSLVHSSPASTSRSENGRYAMPYFFAQSEADWQQQHSRAAGGDPALVV
jgi:hypothetical protein